MSGSRLLLFDIDQTLIFCAGAGMRCLHRAVREHTGVVSETITVHPDGKTDPAILEEILEVVGVDSSVSEAVWQSYEVFLAEELAREDERRGVKPGVDELLDALSLDERAYLGLLTGNLAATARVKLAAFDLDQYFAVGAYGSDSPDRCALGPIALQRARAHWGVGFEPHQTWVIGDTPRDVEAARALGARVLAVATGVATVDDLRQAGADVVLADLGDTKRVTDILLNASVPPE